MTADRTVCVLGGSGFVGHHLCTRWIKLGYSVRVPTRSRARHRDLLVLPGLTLVQTDVHDPDVLRELFTGCAAVVNLIGILNERGRKGRGFERAHVELARKVVDACAATGVRRLLHMSALKADMSGAPSHYLRTKGEAERIVRGSDQIAATIFRPSTIFGPDDSFVNRFARLLRLPSPVFPLPRAEARFAPVFVGDVVEAFTRCLRDPRTSGESYELCGPRTYTLREIVVSIARASNLRRHITSLPDGLARLQARLMDFLPGKPFSTDNYLSLTVDSVCADDGFARLGITPMAFETALAKLAAGALTQRYDRFRRLAQR
jgi:NADH dehydrogenase